MTTRRQVSSGLVFLCVVASGTRVLAQSASDPVSDALQAVTNAVPTPGITFVAIAPCRLADTRPNGVFPPGPFGPPSMAAQVGRVFPIAGQCGIPATAQAVSANLAVTNTSAAGFISVWPGGDPQPTPLVASQNFAAGQTIANAVLAPLGAGGITVYARVGLDLIIDVNGYFDTVVEPQQIVISDAQGSSSSPMPQVIASLFGNLTTAGGSFTKGRLIARWQNFAQAPACTGNGTVEFVVNGTTVLATLSRACGGRAWLDYSPEFTLPTGDQPYDVRVFASSGTMAWRVFQLELR